MTTYSGIAGLPLPGNDDVLNANQAFGDYAEGADSLLIPRFADTSARDAALNPALIAGMLCTVAGATMYYDGTRWCPFEDYVFVRKTADTVKNSTTTPTADTHLVLSLLGGWVWEVDIFLYSNQGTGTANNPAF